MTQPEKDECGLWRYKTVPVEATLFTMQMYDDGYLKKNIPFLIYSEAYDEYQYYRITENSFEWILPFIRADRMFYMDRSKEISAESNAKKINKSELKFKF